MKIRLMAVIILARSVIALVSAVFQRQLVFCVNYRFIKCSIAVIQFARKLMEHNFTFGINLAFRNAKLVKKSRLKSGFYYNNVSF